MNGNSINFTNKNYNNILLFLLDIEKCMHSFERISYDFVTFDGLKYQ